MAGAVDHCVAAAGPLMSQLPRGEPLRALEIPSPSRLVPWGSLVERNETNDDSVDVHLAGRPWQRPRDGYRRARKGDRATCTPLTGRAASRSIHRPSSGGGEGGAPHLTRRGWAASAQPVPAVDLDELEDAVRTTALIKFLASI